jgi:hypothetical protein
MGKVLGLLLILGMVIPAKGQIMHGDRDDNFRVFDGGVILGLNFTQVHGDNLAGFNKIGINTGGIAHINFNRNWSMSFEILYSQKGSATLPDPNDPFEYKLNLQYAEIPVMVNYNDKNRLIFSAGLGYGRLFSVREVVNGNETANIEAAFNTNELSYLFGGTFLIGEMRNFGINLRYQGSITAVGESANPAVPGLANVILSLRGIYYF